MPVQRRHLLLKKKKGVIVQFINGNCAGSTSLIGGIHLAVMDIKRVPAYLSKTKHQLKIHVMRYLNAHFQSMQCCIGATESLCAEDYGKSFSVASVSLTEAALNPSKRNEGPLFFCLYSGLMEPVTTILSDWDTNTKLQGGLRGELLHPPTATQPEEEDCHLQVRRRPTPGQAQDWGSCQTNGPQGQEKQNGPNSMCFQVCAPSQAFCERKEAYSEIIRLVKRGCATQIGSCAESTASYHTGSNHQWNTVAHYWPLPRDAGRLGMMMITMKTTSEDGLQQMPV